MLSATIGGFDGIHSAHQELIKKADIVIIIEKGSTLTPGFDRYFYIDKPLEFLKLEEIKYFSAEVFIEYLKKLNISKVIIGEDFRFGKNRSGDINLLKKHFKVEIIKEIKYKNIPIHSRKIRELINSNKIELANTLLNRPYKIRGYQIRGQGLGEKLLPTINIKLLKPYTLPQGVFITKTNSFPSLTFIGIRSTDNNFSIETHLLHFKNPQEIIEIEFLKFLRENRKFKDLISLKKAIEEDKNEALNFFKVMNNC